MGAAAQPSLGNAFQLPPVPPCRGWPPRGSRAPGASGAGAGLGVSLRRCSVDVLLSHLPRESAGCGVQAVPALPSHAHSLSPPERTCVWPPASTGASLGCPQAGLHAVLVGRSFRDEVTLSHTRTCLTTLKFRSPWRVCCALRAGGCTWVRGHRAGTPTSGLLPLTRTPT